MIAVYIDPAISKYSNLIKYSLNYLLEIGGYSWKYLEDGVEIEPNDLVIYYSVNLPENDIVDMLIRHHSVIFIPFVKNFYIPGAFSGDNLKNFIKTFKYEVDVPIISTKKGFSVPLKLSHRNNDLFACFEFDLIGNIYFQLVDDDKNHLNKKDSKGNLCLEELGFYDYFNVPFINYYLDVLDKLINELVSNRQHNSINCFQIKRCLWPSNQSMAAILSHNLDRLQKWNIISILISFLEHPYLFLSFRWKYLFRSLASKYKYFFTNQEDYWNFYDISFYERKYKFRPTWFIGVNSAKENIFDYEIDDKDLIKELLELYDHGAELSIFSNKLKPSMEDLRKNIEDFVSTLKINNKKFPNGIRHSNLDNENSNLHKIHTDLHFKYSSTKKIPHRNCFINGFSLPFPIYSIQGLNNRDPLWEIPITFTDETLYLTKYKYIPFDVAMNSIKELIKSVKKVRGLVHFQFSNSLFYEIPYMHKLFEYTVDQLNNQNAYVATCSTIIDWLNKRQKVLIKETENRIIIDFNDNIEQMCFEIIGNKVIANVEGGNCSFQKNFVHFINITKGLSVEIFLIDFNQESEN